MDDHFGQLPAEIQVKIFDYVGGKADLLECQLTCKLWNKHSTQVLYKIITFDDMNIEKMNEFIETLNKYGKDLMVLVEQVQLLLFPDFQNEQKILLKFFLDNCPNIRICVCGITDESYIESLNTESWKHLENFTSLDLNKSKQLIEIAKQHKETIKEFKLHESAIPKLCDNKQNIKEKLVEFKSLEKIIITLEHFRHLSSLDNMIPENVKSLKLNLEDSSFEQKAVLLAPPIYEEETIDEQETTIPQDIDLREIIPCPNIKELILEIPLNNENSFKYLMHKFPKLEKLYYGSEEVISVSEDTREAFTDYLLGIKNINVMYTLVCKSDSPTDYFFIKKLIESSKTKDSKQTRDFTAIICTYDPCINAVQVTKETNNGIESYKISTHMDKLQNLNLLKSFGADLTGLDVFKVNNDGLSFSKILMLCPNLNYLRLSIYDSDLEEKLKGNTKSLEALEYFGCEHFTPEILTEWPKHFPNLTNLVFSSSADIAIDLSSIITAFPNLVSLEMSRVEILLSNTDKKSYTVKKLGLNNCRFPSNSFFSDLSSYLPNVCELEIHVHPDDEKSREFILDMPETSFQSLFIRPSHYRSRHSTALLKTSLSVNDKETDSNKQYYVSTCPLEIMKKCTETEYESFTSEKTKDLGAFQLTVNCKEFPRIVERMKAFYVANMCGAKHSSMKSWFEEKPAIKILSEW